MKNIPFYCLALLSGTMLLLSCSKPGLQNRDTVAVLLKDCSEKKLGVTICFDSLISDSRCPAGMTCIWAGTSIIRVSLKENGQTNQFTMSVKYHPSLRNYPSDTTINGYKISFIDLKPYPGSGEFYPFDKPRAYFTLSK